MGLHGDWKITLQLQYSQLLSVKLTKQVLNCSHFFPIKGRLRKYNLLFTIFHRAFKCCSKSALFDQEIDKIKTIFTNNDYPKIFVDIFIKKYLNKVFIKKEVILKPSKKNLFTSFLLLQKCHCN